MPNDIPGTVFPGCVVLGTLACAAGGGGQRRRVSKRTYYGDGWVPGLTTIPLKGGKRSPVCFLRREVLTRSRSVPWFCQRRMRSFHASNMAFSSLRVSGLGLIK